MLNLVFAGFFHPRHDHSSYPVTIKRLYVVGVFSRIVGFVFSATMGGRRCRMKINLLAIPILAGALAFGCSHSSDNGTRGGAATGRVDSSGSASGSATDSGTSTSRP